MRLHRFYLPGELACEQTLFLPGDVVQHIRALRISPETPILLFNGNGQDYQATIIFMDKKSVQVQIENVQANTTESPLHIHIGQVIARAEKMDWIIQKATELGVQAITPLFSDYCNVKLPHERMCKKQAHWQKVAISAAEQCGRACIPTIHSPSSFANWLDNNESDINLLLHPHEKTFCLKDLHGSTQKSFRLLIGPEGGFSDSEIDTALKAQFKPVVLGPRILRTETAAMAMISALQTLLGDF